MLTMLRCLPEVLCLYGLRGKIFQTRHLRQEAFYTQQCQKYLTLLGVFVKWILHFRIFLKMFEHWL